MFNGTDLPVAPYIDLVASQNLGTYGDLVRTLGPILSAVSWAVAPTAQAELEALGKLSNGDALCPTNANLAPVQAARQRAYARARTELRAAAKKRRAKRHGPANTLSLTDEDRGYEIISALPATYAEYQSTAAKAPSETGPFKAFAFTPGSGIDFVLEMFQYRYTSFARYLNDFESASGRRVDLVLSALVDYDWWLNGGNATETRLADQVKLMADLAVATGGRLHYWVPFCPYRQAQYRQHPGSTFSSLALAQYAVRQQGAVGVKIYPPMGFAAFGNSGLSPTPWTSASWLTGLAKTSTFGTELDQSLRELYDWCVQEDVPILAHANNSSGPSAAFDALAGPEYWEQALAYAPGLRVIFGHFGGAEDPAAAARAEHFIALMASAGGAHANADVSYFSQALDNPTALQSALGKLFMADADPKGVLPTRLLFGSDWKMLLLEAHANLYLKDFAAVFTALAQHPPAGVALPSLPADALGRNALTGVGLHKQGAARKRIDAFYAARGVAEPQWMRAADTVS
jgi:hypothetical protein